MDKKIALVFKDHPRVVITLDNGDRYTGRISEVKSKSCVMEIEHDPQFNGVQIFYQKVCSIEFVAY